MSAGEADDRPADESGADVGGDWLRVQSQVESARIVLARLLQEVVVAQTRLGQSRAAQVLAADEQALASALRSQTEAATAAERLARLALSADLDPLTHLPNEALMLERGTQALVAARARRGRVALLVVNLNNFRHVNDTLGRVGGDEVLQRAAHRLLATVSDADTVGCHGGDEFAVLLGGVAGPADAARRANDLLLALALPSRVDDRVLRLTASIGIAVFPDDGNDMVQLLDRARVAMRLAKRQGLGRHAFFPHDAASRTAAPRPPVVALIDPLAQHEAAVAEHRRRYAELRAANQELALAVLDAQQLQAAAEQARRRQAEFMSVVARELDNPLAPIRMAAAMLGEAQSADPLLPHAQSIIEQQVQSMARLVQAVQAVSQVGTAAFTLASRAIDLVAVVDSAVAACRPTMDTRLQTFVVDLPEHEVPVLGDETKLAQVVRNLLDNASQFTPDLGQIRLELSVQGDSAELVVADSGIGITALALPTVFDPFVQDNLAIGFNGIGVGIGLTVVRALVEAHGGEVGAESSGIGRGSRFTVRLPLTRQPLPSAVSAAGPGGSP